MAEAAAQTWRDRLLPASFRGVPFRVVSADGHIGRRNVVHEFPGRDLPLAEDLGRKAREFSVEAFVIGDNYMDGRDKLIDAIEAYGSGELVHPYRGRMQVIVTGQAKVSESTAEGGMARFTITFTESGEAVNPAPRVDTKAAVETAADEAQVEAEKGFFDDFNVDGLQDFVPTEALAIVTKSLDNIQLAANKLLSGGLLPEFTHQLFSLANSASSLIRLPANLTSGIFGQIKALAGIANNPLGALSGFVSFFGLNDRRSNQAAAAVSPAALSAVIEALAPGFAGSGSTSLSTSTPIYVSSPVSAPTVTLSSRQAAAVTSYSATVALGALRPLFDFGSTAKPVPNSIGGAPYINKAGTPIYIGQTGLPAVVNTLVTPSRQQQAVNQAAVINLVQRAAVIEAARLITKVAPASYGEAIALRDEIADKLEELAETAPDRVYVALSKLRIAVIKDITARAADLSRAVNYTVPVTLPALVVAHRLYGNCDQADGIVARNHIRHPGFVPGGRVIEVLTS